MVEPTIIRQEVRPEKVETLQKRLAELDERGSEIIETLQNEGVKTETAFLEESPHGTFLVTYMEAADLQEAQETFEESTLDIDIEYKQIVRDCLVDGQPVGRFEPLYHAANPDR